MDEHSLGDRELMRFHVEALFTYDASGRMLRVNEPGAKEAPRFFLGRTADDREPRFRWDLDDALVDELTALCSAGRADDGLRPHRGWTPYHDVLARSAPIRDSSAGPAYRFPRELPEAPGAVLVTKANADILRPHLEEWIDGIELQQPAFAVVVDGHAAAVCCSVRISPSAYEVGVETARSFRGRGYAVQVVAAWAAAVRAIGRIPLYSTSWENGASQAVARKLGLQQYGTDFHIA